MKNKSKTIVLLVSIIAAVCLAFGFLFKAVSKKISGNEPHQQTSVVEKTEDPVSTPEATVSAENPDESSESEPLELYAKEQEINKRREKTAKYAQYSMKMNIRITEHTGTESLEEKTFWFTDYEEDSDKNAVIDAFEYGLSGKDDFYITYVSENGTQGVKYQIATDELDQTYSENIMTGE